MSKPTWSEQEIKQVAAESMVDVRTIKRTLSGEKIREVSRLRILNAARRLKFKIPVVILSLVFVGCGSSNTNPVFGASTGGAAGVAGVGGEAGAAGTSGAGGEAGVAWDAGATDAEVVCNNIVCDEQTSCANTTCTEGDAATKWCRKLNGTYAWIVQAFCGTPEFPYGSTLLECDAGLRVCCSKTGDWAVNC
jgi:hypothetical protein